MCQLGGPFRADLVVAQTGRPNEVQARAQSHVHKRTQSAENWCERATRPHLHHASGLGEPTRGCRHTYNKCVSAVLSFRPSASTVMLSSVSPLDERLKG